MSNQVFICGFPSSGTDLLKNLMNAHPQIYIGGEFPLLASLARRYNHRLTPEAARKAIDDIVGCDVYGNLARRSLEPEIDESTTFANVYTRLLCPSPVTWAGNKTPQNSENIRQLDHLFPAARFLLIVRDIRDVALSWQNKWGKDPLLCAHRWNTRMTYAIECLSKLKAERYIVVTYESLLEDHAKVASDICRFLGMDFDSRMADQHLFVTNPTPGKLNYGQPVIRENTQKWRNFLPPAVVKRIEEIGFRSMQRFGYECEFARFEIALNPIAQLRGRLRDLWAMAAVGNRALPSSRLRYFWDAVRLEIAKRFGRYRRGR